MLEGATSHALTLVSAPAGFGKTALVSDWLGSQDRPCAWLSLDGADSDLRTFLHYFVAAVRTVAPDACGRTALLLQNPDLPAVSRLSATLANELEAVDIPFFVALDDYHCIGNLVVHDLVAELIRRPPRPLHLTILSRHDPPLPLATLRAHGYVAEVRQEHLRFSRSESADLLYQLAGVVPGDRALDNLERQNEGWAVGLQMIGLALRGRADPDSFLRNLRVVPRSARDYLAREVLDVQPAGLRDWLIETSILDRFCAPLCEMLCGSEGAAAPGMDGDGFLAMLEERGLFAIALDPQGEWYRYHHVFRDLMRAELEARRSPEQIAALHSRASRWFADRDRVEEALDHALAAGDSASASGLVARRRQAAMNREDWHRLNGWLDRLPADSIEADPRLLMARAWCLSFLNRTGEGVALLEKARATPLDAFPDAQALVGEMEAFTALSRYLAMDVEGALRAGTRALHWVPGELECVRGYAAAVLAWAHSASGRAAAARELLWRLMETSRDAGASYQARLQVGLTAVLFREGDLAGCLAPARCLLEIAKANSLAESMLFARSFLGWAHYLRNELDEAELFLEAVVEERGPGIKGWHAQCHFALALCHAARGRIGDARQVAQGLTRAAIERQQPVWIEEGRAFEADLALRQGRIAEARAWAETFDSERPLRFNFFYIPQLTLAKLRLAEGTAASRRQAVGVLERLRCRLEEIHDELRVAETLAVEALVHQALGDETLAIEKVEASLASTEPGGAIRPYLDLGAPMAALLKELPAPGCDSEHVRHILAAFDGESARERAPAARPAARSATAARIEPLTNREQDVLELLAERYRDKEIAARLSVSPATVRSHLKVVYQKLDAHDRREAVVRARELGILRMDGSGR